MPASVMLFRLYSFVQSQQIAAKKLFGPYIVLGPLKKCPDPGSS